MILTAGCATQFVAMGDWADPSDLHLNDQSLAGVKLSVRCNHMDKQGIMQAQNYPLCQGLERHLASLGAQIIPNTQSGADLTVWYIEEGVVDKHISAGSVIGLIATAYIIPMVSTATSRAELRITDNKGSVVEQESVSASKVRVFGWSAWLALGKKSRQRDLGEKFYTYVKNRVVSRAVDLKLAKATEEDK